MDDTTARPTALITGASSGIGYELALAFARRGHDLVLTARREERLRELAAALPEGVEVTVLPMDLAKGKGPARLLDELPDAGVTVDVLVNNAGVAASGPLQRLEADAVRRMLQLNVRALTELTHSLLPGMLQRGHGRILKPKACRKT